MNQELINISCLVDGEREFSVDTHQEKGDKMSLIVDSFSIPVDTALARYVGRGKLTPLIKAKLFFRVCCVWLKSYLDWFDPQLFQYITRHADGVKVHCLITKLGGDDEASYEQQGHVVHDKLMVPLPQLHPEVSTRNSFGVTMEDGVFHSYAKHVFF